MKRWERKEGGEKVLVEKPIRTSKWWQPDQSGGYVMTVKIGSKRIEFEKGKAAIAVGSLEKLPTVIDVLIKAVGAGELDDQLLSRASLGGQSPPAKWPDRWHSRTGDRIDFSSSAERASSQFVSMVRSA